MIISKTNVIVGNTIALTTGTISSGALANVVDPNFSKVLSSTSNPFEFTVEAVGSSQYVALHGLNLPVGTVVNVTGTSFVKTFTLTRAIKNLIFYVESAVTPGDLSIEFVGAGTKTISYMQAGLVSEIAWGTSPGQPLHYLAPSIVSRSTSTANGLPTNQIQEEEPRKLSLNIQNAYKTWARTELQDIFSMYNQTGILSLLDYQEDNKPEESVALFELNDPTVKTHSQTTSLCDVSFSFKVVA